MLYDKLKTHNNNFNLNNLLKFQFFLIYNLDYLFIL